MVYERTGLSHGTSKEQLRPGDHIYAWKLGYTFSHHGIVVKTEACDPSCDHSDLRCCTIVHFCPASEEVPPRIALASLAEFLCGRQVCRCHYGVPAAEFFLKRSGTCSTDIPDPWPLVVIRALSLVELSPQDFTDDDVGAEMARMEYDILRRNSELLARWCKLGTKSGVRRFCSDEAAFSLQTSPGRFFRLGLATAVAAGVVITTAGVASTAGAPAAPAAAAAAATGSGGGHAAAAAAGNAAQGAAVRRLPAPLRPGGLLSARPSRMAQPRSGRSQRPLSPGSCSWTSRGTPRRRWPCSGTASQARPRVPAPLGPRSMRDGTSSGRARNSWRAQRLVSLTWA